jgi:acyl-CoA thioester hydrolase
MNSSGDQPRSLLSELDLVVRMYDIDFNGHVSNIVYIRWLEDMRMVGFEKIVPIKSCLDLGQVPVLIRTDIRYRRPVKMFDEPKGLLWVSGYTKTTFILEAEILVRGTRFTDATQTGVFVNESTGKLIRLPDSLVKRFQEENIPVLDNKS